MYFKKLSTKHSINIDMYEGCMQFEERERKGKRNGLEKVTEFGLSCV